MIETCWWRTYFYTIFNAAALKNIIFQRFFILIPLYYLCATNLNFSCPFCNVLHFMNIRHWNCLVADINSLQYVLVRTAAFTDGCQTPRYITMTKLLNRLLQHSTLVPLASAARFLFLVRHFFSLSNRTCMPFFLTPRMWPFFNLL